MDTLVREGAVGIETKRECIVCVRVHVGHVPDQLRPLSVVLGQVLRGVVVVG